MLSFKKISLVAALCFGLLACGDNPDPFEPVNRVSHTINKAADGIIIRPVSKVYDFVIPDDAQVRISNLSNHLDEPKNFINHVLQGNPEAANNSLYRFFVNTVAGFGGFGDPASGDGHFPNPTNFDQTLASWGVPPGPYLELPILGPSTVRSKFGTAVDGFIDPFPRLISSEQEEYFYYFEIISRINDRARYGSLIDLVLYLSADSYVATRQAYLDSQREKPEAGEPAFNEEGVEMVELENFYEFE